MIVNMILASNDVGKAVVFIGCNETAHNFAEWLAARGWLDVAVVYGVESCDVARTPNEVEFATALCNEYGRVLAMH